MRITRLRTCHLKNPLGFDIAPLTLSWSVSETPSKAAAASRVRIATDEAFDRVVFDSGFCELDSRAYRPDFVPQSCTRYFWSVAVRGDKGDSAVSQTAWFDLGPETLTGRWITPDDRDIHPYIRKTFNVGRGAKRAYLCAVGLGVYEAEINGARVGAEYLAPGCHAYDRWMQYQTYDVTDLLVEGDNAICFSLANGWAKGRFGLDGGACKYTDRFCLLCDLQVVYDSGVETVCKTDETWRWHPSDVLADGIYDGETVDARLTLKGRSGAGCDANGWLPVRLYEPKVGPLCKRLSPPIVTKHYLKPQSVITTTAGETVLDMGQNMVGFVEFVNPLPAGETLTLTFGEILQNDCFYTENLRSAKQQFIYTSDGSPELVRPRFTFYGFRYVKVEGWRGLPLCDDFTAHVVYSDLDETGSIETANAEVNRLLQNAVWSQRGNFVDVPTDCPQRDERMGWTGDAQVFSGTALFNMDSYTFYRKFMRDLNEEQQKNDGGVPHVVPDVMSKPNKFEGDACAWGDAATVIPWNTYQFSGDRAILEQCFDGMKARVDHLRRIDDANGGSRLWKTGFHFGDWLALDNYIDRASSFGGTDEYYCASAYYYYSATLVSKAAAVLGRDDKAIEYKCLADEILAAIRCEYFSQNGRLCVETQTAHVVALQLGLSPDARRTAEALVKLIERNKNRLTTGFIGTPWLCRVLTDAGYNEIAYTLFLSADYPSWLYAVRMGATTIWERWNSVLPDGSMSDTGMNSLNHYAYGSIAEWVYRCVCGLNPQEAGFRHAQIAPQPDRRLGWARCDVETASGRFCSGWRYEGDELEINVSVPFGATATLVLPLAKQSEVSASASSLRLRQKGENVETELVAGDYSFTYVPIGLARH